MNTELNKRAKRNSKHTINYHVLINDSNNPIASFKTHRKALAFIKNGINLVQYDLTSDSVIKVVKEKYSINVVSQHAIKPVTAMAAVDLGLD